MGPRGRRAAIVTTMVALSMLVAGGVVAATRSSDEAASAPTRHAADRGIERRVDVLLRQMTVDEKLQQVQLLSDGQITDADAKAGVGSVFSLVDPAKINHFQHIAVEQSRLHIPILFAYDTIHGYRTIFPVPLGAASSFDPSVPTADDTVGARETATVGIKQIYSPMVDVSHEPRWGRISEAAGEDPYLGSVFAAARVKAAQGSDYSAPDKVVTSVKHFAAYGQPEGGREYNTTDMSEQRLRNLYLPPFKAAIDAGLGHRDVLVQRHQRRPRAAPTPRPRRTSSSASGASTASSRATTRRSPSCGPARRRTPNEGPCGHGIAADGPDAAQAALNAGTDSEMVSTNIRDFGKQLLAQHRISMARLDDAVRRILRVKFRAGLFEHPYVDQAKAVDPASFVTADDRAAARTRGRQVDGPAQERRHGAAHAPARRRQVDGRDRPAGQRQARHARPLVGPGQGRRRGVGLRRHQGPEPEHHVRPGLHDRRQGPAGQHAGRRVRLGHRLRRGGGRGQGRRPDRPGPRREPRAERRGGRAQRHRPPGPPAGADRQDQRHRTSRSWSCCSTAAR